MSIEAMKQALEALETLARYENPETKIQVRKPKDGGPIVTMYPHKVASDAAQSLRQAIEQAEKQEPTEDMVLAFRGASGLGTEDAIDALRDVLAVMPLYTTPQPQQEPVKMVAYNCLCGRIMKFESVNGIVAPQREWVGITTEEMEKSKPPLSNDAIVWELAVEWAEAKLRSKNT